MTKIKEIRHWQVLLALALVLLVAGVAAGVAWAQGEGLLPVQWGRTEPGGQINTDDMTAPENLTEEERLERQAMEDQINRSGPGVLVSEEEVAGPEPGTESKPGVP